jgi:shikimate dehydrogenase
MHATPPIRASESPTRLVILGDPVAQSLSPVFQNAALQAAGISARYDRWQTTADTLDAVLATCAAERIAGNATMPLKTLLAERAGQLSQRAQQVGAANTFWFDDGVLVAHNTDVDGIAATLYALVGRASINSAVVIGAGGAAAAVLVALHEQRVAQTTLLVRSPARAELMLRRMPSETVRTVSIVEHQAKSEAAALGAADLVINATPIGMHDRALPVDLTPLASHTVVFDLIYRRDGSALVDAARARGLVAEDGLRMLVEQGASAFACWFGKEPDRTAMWRALEVPEPSTHRPRA